MSDIRPSLHSAFLKQIRIIWALMLRETITRFGRRNIGFLWLFIEPLLVTLVITAIWKIWRNIDRAGISTAAFIATGYSVLLLWRNGSSSCTRAISANRGLLHHRFVFVVDVFYARLLLDIISATGAFAMVIVILLFFGLAEPPANMLRVAIAWGLMCWFTIGLGFIVGFLADRIEVFAQLWRTFMYVMFPISGALYMVEWLPERARDFVLWLPPVHGTEMLRHGFFGDRQITHENFEYLFACNLILLFVGLLLARQAEYQVEPN